jgi:hypothetical protein
MTVRSEDITGSGPFGYVEARFQNPDILRMFIEMWNSNNVRDAEGRRVRLSAEQCNPGGHVDFMFTVSDD